MLSGPKPRGRTRRKRAIWQKVKRPRQPARVCPVRCSSVWVVQSLLARQQGLEIHDLQRREDRSPGSAPPPCTQRGAWLLKLLILQELALLHKCCMSYAQTCAKTAHQPPRCTQQGAWFYQLTSTKSTTACLLQRSCSARTAKHHAPIRLGILQHTQVKQAPLAAPRQDGKNARLEPTNQAP